MNQSGTNVPQSSGTALSFRWLPANPVIAIGIPLSRAAAAESHRSSRDRPAHSSRPCAHRPSTYPPPGRHWPAKPNHRPETRAAWRSRSHPASTRAIRRRFQPAPPDSAVYRHPPDASSGISNHPCGTTHPKTIPAMIHLLSANHYTFFALYLPRGLADNCPSATGEDHFRCSIRRPVEMGPAE